MNDAVKTNPWIHSPKVDLTFIAFAWVLLFGAYLVIDQTAWRSEGRTWLLYLTLLVTVFHRHLTFPLVYGDPEVFTQRKKTYALLPFFLVLLTAGSLFYVKEPAFTGAAMTQPIAMKRGEGFSVSFREAKQNKTFRVSFTGLEQSVEEVAASIRRGSEGKLLVETVGDSLRVSLPKGSTSDRFALGGFRGRDLQRRLGIPRDSAIGWARDRPLFLLLVLASALWNFWHTLMQKLGILRVYSRKANYGKSWLDRSMVWIWFGCLFFALAASSEVRRQVNRLAASGKFLTQALEPIYPLLPYLVATFAIVGGALTILYFIQEFKNRRNFHWPKNIFLLSIWGIYLTFFYDFLAGYVTFGFSHAIEYLAFVNVYAHRKYLHRPIASSWMARLVGHQGRNLLLFMGVSSLIFIPWFWRSPITLNWYIVTTSFMHFLYDGWIWKVRRPEVGAALGIQYAPGATAA
jgi:hypothetical protein